MTSLIVDSFVCKPKKNVVRRSENVDLQVLHLRSFLRVLPYLSYITIFPSPLFPWSPQVSFGQKKSFKLTGICIYLYISKPLFMSRNIFSKMGTSGKGRQLILMP